MEELTKAKYLLVENLLSPDLEPKRVEITSDDLDRPVEEVLEERGLMPRDMENAAIVDDDGNDVSMLTVRELFRRNIRRVGITPKLFRGGI
ncbi:MAG: hypothetical protein DRJ52_11375 [Thermoprotei archaeon]|nr:MAG: hypothetical protein DRJ52_11375 [Thermoprotei archaeon]RLE99146.1 MAG: hypothetical protein DRJ63_06175 [Thermoprotei archaeon]